MKLWIETFLWDIFYLHKSDCFFCCFFLKTNDVRSHCTMLGKTIVNCTDLSIIWYVLRNYSCNQPCFAQDKRGIIAWKMIKNRFGLISHTAFAPSPSANFYFISGLNSPSWSVPYPRNSWGDVESCTVYTQCLNRGLL